MRGTRMITGRGTVLAHARIVHHDRVDAAPLSFTDGRVTRAPQPTAYEIDLRDHLILPGLINAHDHLHLNNVPPLPHDAPFASSYAWIAAFGAYHEHPAVRAAVAVPKATRHRHGALKNLLAGTTTVAHHDPWHPAFDEPAFPVHAVRDAGWSHSLGLAESSDDAPRYGPPVRASFDATPPDRPWVIHLAEGTDDDARAELARLDAIGCLDARTILVHGVGLTPADVDRVLARGAAVVWCPASNVELLGRTIDAPLVRRLVDAGRLALGSDSRLTGARDLLDELRVAAAHADLSARELLRLVTTDARRILRLSDRGALAPGHRADCLVLRADGDPPAALLGATRADIRAVVRDGVPVIADPDFADWFAHCGIATVALCVDGRPKLAARDVVVPEVVAIEPGLALGVVAS